mgnify:CR=1 FL=1
MVYRMATTPQACPFGPGFDFTNPDLLEKGIPVAEFAELRKTAPVWWNEQSESIFDDGGYWVISRHEDVKAISCARAGFSTEENTALLRFDGATVGPDERAMQRLLLLNMDPPHHTQVRGIVSRITSSRGGPKRAVSPAITMRWTLSAPIRPGTAWRM